MKNRIKEFYFDLLGLMGFTFTCKHCGARLPYYYQMRTKGYCHLDDPNVTLNELLEDRRKTIPGMILEWKYSRRKNEYMDNELPF